MSRQTAPDRRRFLAAASAVTAVPAAAAAADPDPRLAAGLIDCQSHLFCPEYLALMEKRMPE